MRQFASAILAIGFAAAFAGPVSADEAKKIDWGKFQVGETRSGLTYAEKETRTMQEDEFQNPGFIWIERGEELWDTVDGKAGKACATCHSDASDTMAKVGATYPVFDKKTKKMMTVQQRINQCRGDRMEAKPWKWEADDMLAMSTYVNHQANGKPMSVKIDGPAKPFYEKGKAFYEQRRGQLDMACTNCHIDNAGKMIRANRLSQGQGNGFPTYRLKWQKIGSLHRRFIGCNRNIRATPFKRGSEEYTNLELYVKSRAAGLPVETPAVRN